MLDKIDKEDEDVVPAASRHQHTPGGFAIGNDDDDG